jgi:hypothetical protein
MFEDAIKSPPMLPAFSDLASEDVCISLDYGTMNAFAALLWVRQGRVWYAVREYYYSGREKGVQKTDEQYAQDMETWIADVIPETALRVIIDPSAASFIALISSGVLSLTGT